MLSGNKEPLSALSSEMKIVSIMRKMNTPAHFSEKHGKCQRTYINTNKARSMKEIPEQLSIRATIKRKPLPYSKPDSAATIYHTPSRNATALHFFITDMRFFKTSLCISNCWFPCRVTPEGWGTVHTWRVPASLLCPCVIRLWRAV